MIKLNQLVHYVNQLLNIKTFADYCPNGLQVNGRETVKKIITGVSACQLLLDAAVNKKADAIIVHHGYFWKNEDPCVVGSKYQHLQTLLKNEMSLLAYHLPLDAHGEFGNNAQLGKLLNFELLHRVDVGNNLELLNIGKLNHSMQGAQFSDYLTHKLARKPLHIAGSDRGIKTIAWCTGAAQDFIEMAIAQNVDAYLTGEVSERTVHIARENKIHFFAAGHHATEKCGIKALGEHLALEFQLEHEFIDIDNPV